MIGIYDYTVILTYLSMVSGATGIIISMTGIGHPYLGILFLMISGLLDAFDGKVARTKKNRTEFEKNFGVQIDSLSDLICFGVLPATIGMAQLRISGRFTDITKTPALFVGDKIWVIVSMIVIAVFYILAALIRLAYFNVTGEERKEEAKKTGVECFTGLPVTTAALIFPLALILHWFAEYDLTYVYFAAMFLLGILFIGNFRVPKPKKLGLIIMIIVGILEFAATVYILYKA